MKIGFSTSWISSKQPRKQRKYRFNAPLHIKQKFLGCHLSKELREKHERRSISVKKGDKVKVLRGQFKGKEGSVERVSVKHSKVYVQSIEFQKKDGSKAFHPLEASNMIITELNMEDKRRIKNGKEPSKKTGDK